MPETEPRETEPRPTVIHEHSEQTRARVLELYRECGRVDEACRVAGVGRTCHYEWMKSDPAYKAAFDEAKPQVMGLLRDVAVKRAVDGSDDLLKFLLKTGDPQQYGDSSKLAVSNPDGTPLFSLDALRAYVQQGKDHKP